MIKKGDYVEVLQTNLCTAIVFIGEVFEVIDVEDGPQSDIVVKSHNGENDGRWFFNKYDIGKGFRKFKKRAEEDMMNLMLIEVMTKIEVPSLSYKVNIKDKKVEIGCQHIAKKDAITLARSILKAYGEQR